jgi:hypothetical protein
MSISSSMSMFTAHVNVYVDAAHAVCISMLPVHIKTACPCPRPCQCCIAYQCPFRCCSSVLMLHVSLHVACPDQGFMSMSSSMLHAYVHAAFPCPCFIAHVHAAYPGPCCMSKFMLHVNVSVTCPLCMHMMHGRAA